MDKKCIELTIGSLLHDVGKVLYRYNDGRNHSASGYDFLNELGIENKAILNQVRYHHKKMLSGSRLEKDDLAYITYWADNVAAAADRRENENTDEYGYDKFVPLSSIFNILNENQQDYVYELDLIYDNGVANEPKQSVNSYSKTTYSKLIENLKEGLAAIELNDAYVNSLLSVLESNFSFVPSSTDKRQFCDISLYDHSKITAVIASCAYNYFIEENTTDFYEEIYKNEKELNQRL